MDIFIKQVNFQLNLNVMPNIPPQIWVNIPADNGILPTGNKPLPERMLTNHQWGLVF